MKKRTIRILLNVFMVISMLCMNVAYGSNIFGSITPTFTPSAEISSKASKIIGAIQWIGYIIAIGMIIWVGVKYLMSGAGEKAKAKETMIPIVIGAVLVAGAATLASVLFTTVK